MKKSLILLAAVAALGLQACDVQVHDAKTTVHEPQNAPPDNTQLRAPDDQSAAAPAPTGANAAASAPAASTAAAPASATTETTAAAPAPADTAAAATATTATDATAAASAPQAMAAASEPAASDNAPATATQSADAGSTTNPQQTTTMGAPAEGQGAAAPTELQRFFEENGSRIGAAKAGATPANPPAQAAPAKRKVSYQLPTMRDPGDPEGSQLLAQRPLLIPVVGVAPEAVTDNYEQSRGSGKHEAVDILAPRGTPVVAVDDGSVVKLFTSKKGGLTVYQFDPQRQLAYYYAHLDHYAAGLREGMSLRRGDAVGYVGTTGDADPGTPHLHFAVFRLGPEKQWWKGAPVNPYGALHVAQPSTSVASR